jgi:hypothetical protein
VRFDSSELKKGGERAAAEEGSESEARGAMLSDAGWYRGRVYWCTAEAGRCRSRAVVVTTGDAHRRDDVSRS